MSTSGVLAVVEARRNIAKMLIVVVCMFALCYLPVHLINMLRWVESANQRVTHRYLLYILFYWDKHNGANRMPERGLLYKVTNIEVECCWRLHTGIHGNFWRPIWCILLFTVYKTRLLYICSNFLIVKFRTFSGKNFAIKFTIHLLIYWRIFSWEPASLFMICRLVVRRCQL